VSTDTNQTAFAGTTQWWPRLKQTIRDWIPLGRLSYSQEGEDLILARLLGAPATSGFFVDVGAHHPVRFSNTYYFYRRGWCGINVDPLPGTEHRFRRLRPRDITLECGVAVAPGVLTYHAFNEPALNTFSAEEAAKKAQGEYRVIARTQVPVRRLDDLLNQHLPAGTAIDFMTIDAEGLDFEIVQSNDWQRYRPRFVLVELLETGLAEIAAHPTALFLADHGYRACAKSVNTVFFVDSRDAPA